MSVPARPRSAWGGDVELATEVCSGCSGEVAERRRRGKARQAMARVYVAMEKVKAAGGARPWAVVAWLEAEA